MSRGRGLSSVESEGVHKSTPPPPRALWKWFFDFFQNKKLQPNFQQNSRKISIRFSKPFQKNNSKKQKFPKKTFKIIPPPPKRRLYNVPTRDAPPPLPFKGLPNISEFGGGGGIAHKS